MLTRRHLVKSLAAGSVLVAAPAVLRAQSSSIFLITPTSPHSATIA